MLMSVQQKLQKGRDRLNKAGNDSDLLGLALTSIHGALEDACRNWLSAPAIKQQHGVDVQNKSEANWQNVLELMPRYCGWSDRDVRYVRKMNSLRNQAAHGDGFEGTRQDIEQYLSYVEKAIAKSGTFSSSASETLSSSGSQYFHNNIAQGGEVTPFRFLIERSDKGVKISNCRGAKIISISGRPLNFLQSKGKGILSLVIAYLGVMAIFNAVVGFFTMIFTGSFSRFTISIVSLLILKYLFDFFENSSCSVFITSDRIYIGKKSYLLSEGTYFRAITQKTDNLQKVYVIQPHGVVYFAHHLTWHEANELITIAAKSTSMINDSRSQFTVKSKDGLIFINSCKTKLSFVVEHNEKLWQSLQCRTLKNNLVELTKSELEELYSKKLQAFNV